ncbi:MAG: OmpH family outer membrane protein [Phycisphaeraceae bacterium]|nr:OmpH family outer membrane protein [Phycisphaeraceae bacterium]
MATDRTDGRTRGEAGARRGRLALLAAAVAGGALVLGARSASVAEPPAPEPVRVAVCDVVRASSLVMETEAYTRPLTERRSALAAQLENGRKEVDALAGQLQALGPNDRGPEAQALAQRFQQKREAFAQATQTAEREFEQFRAAKNYEAYRRAVAAADAVAARRGYTIVIASRAMDEAAVPVSGQAFLQGVLARPVIRWPKGDDITADVFAELKVSPPAPTDAPPAPAAGTPPAKP